jgi:hypothetical protein
VGNLPSARCPALGGPIRPVTPVTRSCSWIRCSPSSHGTAAEAAPGPAVIPVRAARLPAGAGCTVNVYFRRQG